MPRARRVKSLSTKQDDSVFLNVPYDPAFSSKFLAYICGICAFGLIPRVTLEVQDGTRRLDRIIGLIKSCRYAIHDLSWVTLSPGPSPTPRFNMPFELGLSVFYATRPESDHTWFLFESEAYRVQKSLSDLNGTDAYIHENSVEGVFRELAKAFIRVELQPTVMQMKAVYDKLEANLPRILADGGATDPFNARAFSGIVVFASALAQSSL